MAGYYLQEELGADQVYAIFPHTCQMTNMGRVDGRLCLGLFDTAIVEVGGKPMAFPLNEGPFGEEAFDVFPDRPMQCRYKDGYSAYLYLGPLPTEFFSPLIAGFYTDDFVLELDRRFRMMNGRGWAESYRLDKMDTESFIDWMSNSWGKPRSQWRRQMLGPTDAWQYGSNWQNDIKLKMLEHALEHPEVITRAAEKLINAIRNADYEHHYGGKNWQSFLPDDCEYMVAKWADKWVRWMCQTFKDNPIQSVEFGDVFKSEDNRPAISYILTLKDNKVLEGILPFEYRARQQDWMGVTGLDWHLKR
ncbi:MAG: hypothetical protein GY869_14280 [Planctomycetes bacterium]|nr:hypothetical protein [Planctomycetota bacterium]